ncbi:META domain-containing protein [Variovorax sp. J22P168]|uniref:META domain-containing protein n=1 Tax=Variovorax jilinensis TaxID=3053513 RepID=UPI0025767DF5|nr:META domain-containing protein [Variovorax sp. J22P168]MDM0014469.1 META domain-containing protein [Variovorax sp. J22P168]
MKTTIPRRLALTLLVALSAAAAGAQPQRPAPAVAPTLPGPLAAIEGPTWRLTQLRGFDAARLPTGPRAVTARFEGGRVSGFSGCNRYFGTYSARDGRLVIGAIGGTMMACEPGAMALETAVHRALAGTFRAQVSGDRLALDSDAGERVLGFQAEPPPALAGLRSNITGFNNGRQAVVSPIAGTTLQLGFGDGVLKGFGGCNTLRANYSVDGNRIRIGPVSSTRRVCPQEGVMAQEREFIAALKSTTTWGFSGALLDMHRADGERTLTGSREAP